MKQYLDIAALEERLQVKRSTLYAWAEEGTIPHLKLGRLLRFDPDEIQAWLLTHRREAKSDPIQHRHRHRRSKNQHIDDLIARAKRGIYTPARGKPDQDRATRKGEKDGSV
jgi:excisionase family DNA binding protein